MRNFAGYAENENFKVGCTGQTTYVYDKDGNELARFKKDILYGYRPMFKPNSNIVVVKSTMDKIAVYDLDSLTLVKKFRFVPVANEGAQDAGMCFSKDGKYFYNIEMRVGLQTCLAIYNTENFELIKRVFENDKKQSLRFVECDEKTGNIYLLGYMRDDEGIFHQPFIAQLENDELINRTNISKEEYRYINGYKDLESHGFTQEKKEWCSLKYDGYDLTDIEKKKIRLADYIK